MFDFGSVLYNYDSEREGGMFYAAYNMKSKNNCLRLLFGYSVGKFVRNSIFKDHTASGPLVSLEIYRKVYEDKLIFLMPSLSVSMSVISWGDQSRELEFEDQSMSIDINFNIISKLKDTIYLTAVPSLSKEITDVEAPYLYGLSVGIIFFIPESN
jgi:hypothetical protein